MPPVYEAIELLRRLIEQRERQGGADPEGRLNLGVAYAALGEYEKGIDQLDRANATYDDPEALGRERERDPSADDHRREARYRGGFCTRAGATTPGRWPSWARRSRSTRALLLWPGHSPDGRARDTCRSRGVT